MNDTASAALIADELKLTNEQLKLLKDAVLAQNELLERIADELIGAK